MVYDYDNLQRNQRKNKAGLVPGPVARSGRGKIRLDDRDRRDMAQRKIEENRGTAGLEKFYSRQYTGRQQAERERRVDRHFIIDRPSKIHNSKLSLHEKEERKIDQPSIFDRHRSEEQWRK